MVRWVMVLGFTLVGVIPSFAQPQTLEAGVFGGMSLYLGDLQQVRFDVDEAHPAYGGFLKYRPSRRFALKGQYYQGHISGSDANYTGLEIRKRNLSFRSSLLELGLQMEFSLAHFGEFDSFKAAPYFFAGLALFYFNPQTKWDGHWVSLQPLGTEGQGLPEYPDRKPYSLIQTSIPLGVGFQLAIAQFTYIGFEAGFRLTFTDYLDDISQTYPDLDLLASHNPMAAILSFRSPEYTGNQLPPPVGESRGNPNNNDYYFFGGMTLSTVIQKWYTVKKPPKRRFRAQF
ncbi:MAG: outer membrane beta-barrel protein [Lewinellaceae bacterium]|nr:outer membrane beta-barrel protein [Lewinellaceae bacterium]